MPRISRRPKLSFTQKELDYLTKLSRSRNQASSIVERSKIVLLSYEGKNDTEISKELKVDYKTVRKWIKRVLDLGVKRSKFNVIVFGLKHAHMFNFGQIQ